MQVIEGNPRMPGILAKTCLVACMEGETPTKTGDHDVSIALDLDRQSRLGEILVSWAARRAGQYSLWSLTYSQLSSIFQQTAKRLELSELHMTLHGLRHGGASHDRATRSRSLAEIQQRGNWKHRESMQRYEKHARIGLQLQRLGKTKVRQLERLADQFSDNCEQLFAQLCLIRHT